MHQLVVRGHVARQFRIANDVSITQEGTTPLGFLQIDVEKQKMTFKKQILGSCFYRKASAKKQIAAKRLCAAAGITL